MSELVHDIARDALRKAAAGCRAGRRGGARPQRLDEAGPEHVLRAGRRGEAAPARAGRARVRPQGRAPHASYTRDIKWSPAQMRAEMHAHGRPVHRANGLHEAPDCAAACRQPGARGQPCRGALGGLSWNTLLGRCMGRALLAVLTSSGRHGMEAAESAAEIPGGRSLQKQRSRLADVRGMA